MSQNSCKECGMKQRVQEKQYKKAETCINLNTLNNTSFKCVQYASVYLSFKIQIHASKIILCIISTHFIHMTDLKIIL